MSEDILNELLNEEDDTRLQDNLNTILQDRNQNLKPENLKQGVTCLGVEGSLEDNEVKLFNTTTELNNDKPINEEQLSIVLNKQFRNAKQDDIFCEMFFPQTVILPYEIGLTKRMYIEIGDSNVADIYINQSSFYIRPVMDDYQFESVEYESTDGIHYTKTQGPDTITLLPALGTISSSDWVDLVGYFIQIHTANFQGVYTPSYQSFDINKVISAGRYSDGDKKIISIPELIYPQEVTSNTEIKITIFVKSLEPYYTLNTGDQVVYKAKDFDVFYSYDGNNAFQELTFLGCQFKLYTTYEVPVEGAQDLMFIYQQYENGELHNSEQYSTQSMSGETSIIATSFSGDSYTTLNIWGTFEDCYMITFTKNSNSEINVNDSTIYDLYGAIPGTVRVWTI